MINMTYQIIDIMSDLVFIGYGLKIKCIKSNKCSFIVGEEGNIKTFKTKKQAREFFYKKYGK